MSDVYGQGHVYAPRAHDAACDWLPRGSLSLDFLTGSQLAIAGDMPVVCSEGFDTRSGLDLLALAGFEPAQIRIPFRSGNALEALSTIDPEAKLVFQHAFPPDAPQWAQSWMDASLLRYLNNKAKLADLAPAGHVPSRRIADRAEFFASCAVPPFVLKAVTEQSSGGGYAVMICRDPADIDRAKHVFEACEQIVLEGLLEIVRSPCLNFAVMPTGDVRYLGFADQDIGPEGKHRGNWLDLGTFLPEAVIAPALATVQRAAAMGYRGFAGVDMALTADDRILVLDLNFRVNASTVPVLLAPALRERFGAVTMHLRKIRGSGNAMQLADGLEPFVRSGRVLPLSVFDPEAAGYAGNAPGSHALIVGKSRDDALETERGLARAGIA